MAINRISIYHLETVLWIDRLGTFAAAAERLNTTQPAISARIRELEGHLGTQLFRRTGRTMSLSPSGRQLLRDIGPLWDGLQRALLDCGGFAEARGVVRIGAGEIAAASCLPAFIADLRSDLPGVSIEIDVDLTAHLIQQLLTAKIDIAFAAGPVAHPALRTAPIGTVELIWLARKDLADDIRRGESGRIAVWSLASHSPIHGRMRDAIAASGLAHGSLNFCNNARLMIDIARSGGGIGIFPEPMVRSELLNGDLVALEQCPHLAPIEFCVAMRNSDREPLTAEIMRRASALRVGRSGAVGMATTPLKGALVSQKHECAA